MNETLAGSNFEEEAKSGAIAKPLDADKVTKALTRIRRSSWTRATFRFVAAFGSFAIIAYYLEKVFSWFAQKDLQNQSWVWKAIGATADSTAVQAAAPQAAAVPSAAAQAAVVPAAAAAQTAAATLAQYVVAALILGMFAFMLWLTRTLLDLGRKQLKLFFRELDRAERVAIVRIRFEHEGAVALSDLRLEAIEPDEED